MQSSTDQLDLQVIGDGYILFITARNPREAGGVQMGGGQSVAIQGSAVGVHGETGVFEADVTLIGDQWLSDGQPVDGPFMEWSEGRVAGTTTLTDAFETADPIDVGFDLVVPEEIQDCSLPAVGSRRG